MKITEKISQAIQKMFKGKYGNVTVDAEMKDGTCNVNIAFSLNESRELIVPAVFEKDEERD